MNLSNYIADLLYRYECVIVPKFGGFVTNESSARLDPTGNILYPPFKQITFNSHLKNNDGLLANYIASVDQISYECAVNFIQFEIDSWMDKLQNQELILPNIGSFNLIGNTLHFEPQQRINYLTSSFGLSNVVCKEVERVVSKEPVLQEEVPDVVPIDRSRINQYLKYAAILVLGLSLIGFGAKYYRDYNNEKLVVEAQKQQQLLEQKIENATFVITKPLPALNLELEEQKKNFHVIAGAFRFPDNADRKLNQLLEQGYKARILGVNKWNLTVVSYGSYVTREEALENLYQIKENVEKDSWLLIQEF